VSCERFDGADVAHLLRAAGGSAGLARLLDRSASTGRSCSARLILFSATSTRRNSRESR